MNNDNNWSIEEKAGRGRSIILFMKQVIADTRKSNYKEWMNWK